MRQPNKLTALLAPGVATPQSLHRRLDEEGLLSPEVTVELLETLVAQATEVYRARQQDSATTLGGPEWDHILAGYLRPYLSPKGHAWSSEAYESPHPPSGGPKRSEGR